MVADPALGSAGYRPPWRLAGLALLTVVGGLLVGAAVTAVGSRIGPGLLVALPVVALLLVAALRRPAFGVALVLLAIPVGLVELPGGLVVEQAVAVAVVGVLLLRSITAGTPLQWPAQLWWGIAVLVLAIAATPRAPDTTLAVKQVMAIVLGLFLVATAAGAVRNIEVLRRLVHVLLAVGFVVCALSLSHASALHAVGGAQRVDNRLRGTFTEPNQFGAFCAVVLMLAVGVALGARSRRERWLAGVAGVSAATAMLLALSRGAWIGAFVGTLLLIALVPSARRGLLAGALVLAVAVPVFGLLTPDLPQVEIVRERVSTLRQPSDNPYDNRSSIWREARREIDRSPWLGQGPGQFPVVSAQSTSSGRVAADHAHNVLLTTAAEIGVPAAAALVGFTLACLGLLLRVARRLTGTPDGPLLVGVGAALAVVVGQGLVDFTLRNAAIYLMLAVLVGLLLAADRLTAAQRTAPSPQL
jgi:putative inorganic carbon (hco3(-)) transporter